MRAMVWAGLVSCQGHAGVSAVPWAHLSPLPMAFLKPIIMFVKLGGGIGWKLGYKRSLPWLKPAKRAERGRVL